MNVANRTLFIADNLNENKRHDFSNWAVTRLGLTPTRDSGDGGKDGVKRVLL